MTRNFRFALISALAILVILGGCELFDSSAELNQSVLSDLDEMRAMIPVIEAGLMIATPEEESVAAAAFGTMTYTPGLTDPDTPDLTYGTATGTVRYPTVDGTYLEDFYGTAGNDAYLTLTPYGTTTLYTVDLYIYPTLSTTVNYVHEQYLVEGSDGTWALSDALGNPDPLNYLVNETVYFDGRVQNTVVQWSRYSDGNNEFYDIPADPVPDDFDDAAYDYVIAEPAKMAAGTGEYSARVVSTIVDEDVTVTEYYTDSDPEGDGLFEKFSISYVETNDVDGDLSRAEETVRRYYQNDVTGEKTVRSRTEAVINYGTYTSSIVITESVDIAKDANDAVTFSSVLRAVNTADKELYKVTTSLQETGAGTNIFEGTMTYDIEGTKKATYKISLNSATGIEITATGGKKTKGKFKGMNRKNFEEFSFELTNGGKFNGKIKNGRMKGKYKKGNQEVDVYLSLSTIFGTDGYNTSIK
ncbi:MAG: hypothetical protein HN368_18665 [Spirochaetales bacterium]|jgi:hypothetical protein|nr:hypothetical protein [Spirochaetales bacterium]